MKLRANNRGESQSKTLATLAAFRSKHTKEDVISDRLLLCLGRDALYTVTLAVV